LQFRRRLGPLATSDHDARAIDIDMPVLGEASVDFLGQRLQILFDLRHELGRIGRQTDQFAECVDLLLILFPADQVIAAVVEVTPLLHIEVA